MTSIEVTTSKDPSMSSIRDYLKFSFISSLMFSEAIQMQFSFGSIPVTWNPILDRLVESNPPPQPTSKTLSFENEKSGCWL